MLTSAEVMRQLGIKRTKFYDLLRAGELTAVNVNPAAVKRHVGERGPRRSIRIAKSEVDAFKARNRIPA